jgi:hypothetical protein
MSIDAKTLKHLIETELARVSDDRVLTHVRAMLVEPYAVLLKWDYGEPDQRYPCWMVLSDPGSGAEIAYSEFGFGPRCPWGLVGSKPGMDHMGMDSGWFTTFLDAFFESSTSVVLPIWRVFKVESDGTRIAITDEAAWETTWKHVFELRNSDPTTRYDCDHSINCRS